jgi:hypothetical protein
MAGVTRDEREPMDDGDRCDPEIIGT